jgi:3-oxoacyl-[acyl-carrier protein] reductase
MGQLDGKVAVITGGSSGIGAAAVKVMVREGAKVGFTYRKNQEGAEKIQAEVGEENAKFFQAVVGDFARADEVVNETREAFGGLDIIVANAGANWDKVIWKMTEEMWDNVLETDLKGTFNYIRAAAPIFKEQKSGKIVAVSSINGIRGKFGQANYAAAKAGVHGLCKSVAKELGRSNVNVNVVCPGLILTEMIQSMPEDFLNKSTEEIVLGRIGTPEEVAEVITFLASDASRHITGEVIKVDGGQYI